MALEKYDFLKDRDRDDWILRKRGADRALRRFPTKKEGLSAIPGIMEGKRASLTIRKENGQIQDERTYPRSADPAGSSG